MFLTAYVRTTTASAFKASGSVSTLPSAASTPKTYSSSGSDTVASSRDRRTRTVTSDGERERRGDGETGRSGDAARSCSTSSPLPISPSPRERARISLEDGAREFGGFGSARALEEDDDGEPDAFGRHVVAFRSLHDRRILVGGEPDEPALRAPSVLRRRGASLAEDVDGQRRESSARGGAVCDRAAHARE